MKHGGITLRNLVTLAGAVAVYFLAGSGLRADDTEIYHANYQAGSTGRPKVLVIFDDSGSMRTVVQEGGERADYDPTASYVSAFDTTKIYWSNNQSPPSETTNNYITASSNRCEESFVPLSTVGKFTSKAKRWRSANGQWETETVRQCVRWGRRRCREWENVTVTSWEGTEAGWYNLSSNAQSPVHMDCRSDKVNPGNPGNGPLLADGYPFEPNSPDAADSDAYTADRSDSNVSWGNSAKTFYSAHYMDWLYDDTIVSVEKDRMQVAQEVVNSLVNTNPGIDFGLATFNNNGTGHNGGRIVQRIVENTSPAQRTALAGDSGIINGLEHDGWTPLCESTYEVYRYLAGTSVYYGDDRDTDVDTPARDLAAEDSSGNYIQPSADCAYTYVILMTDGFPTYDTDANAAIETLTGKTCADYLTDQTQNGNRISDKNCLPILAEYMSNRDLDNDSNNGNQFAITYTIGFGTSQDLLEDTATKGKGEYYQAENSAGLTAAFQGAILSILSTDSTFTSPAVAVDTFTRTQSRNEVFFAMFKPGASMDWRGNIKRLDLSFTSGDAVLVDKNGVPAIDEGTGLIKENAVTMWSTTSDGPKVEKGGVGELLANTSLAARASRMYTNTGTNQALELFNSTNITTDVYNFEDIDPLNPDELLYALWGVGDAIELGEVIQWAIGYDIEDEDEDESINDNRPWILADILHSKPLVVNYGALGSHTPSNPDVRILVGTNAGFLHMFGSDDGEEDWAFFAKELAPVLSKRKDNLVSAERPYGMDGPPVSYTIDLNNDGTIDESVGDKAWLFFGLRRGGSLLYALDISDPDDPTFMWRLDEEVVGLEELGQTWSVPAVSYIPGHIDGSGHPKPVLIFGGGYDPIKDDHNTLAGDNSDTMGRGLFIVDAQTGSLIWSITPAGDSSTNLQETGLVHSVAGSVTTLDSNGDQLTDRIYFADSGGNLWRADLPGDTLPTSSQNTWRIVRMMSANGGSIATDRRFFSAPDVVRTAVGGYPVDAILIGSGDRSNPSELDHPTDVTDPSVSNQFYMIRDLQTNPYFNVLDSVRCSTEPEHDFRCSLPLTPASLYDVTANLLQEGDTAQQAAAETALSNSAGWRFSLEANGEKALARSLTIDGKVYFTTFSPDAQVTNICEPLPGAGRLYNLSLQDAVAVRDFNNDGTLDRLTFVGGLIPDTPSPHFDADGVVRLLLPPGGTSPDVAGNPMETGSTLPTPYGSYWHLESN
ncbi:MAG: type IV pilus assembly protein PilY1 [Halioglobus sp.]|jgi:type IV pilus assembly protein PilY1